LLLLAAGWFLEGALEFNKSSQSKLLNDVCVRSPLRPENRTKSDRRNN